MGELFKIDDKVKDTVTGFVGTITGTWVSKYLTRAYVEGIDSTGRPIDVWVDIERLSKEV